MFWHDFDFDVLRALGDDLTSDCLTSALDLMQSIRNTEVEEPEFALFYDGVMFRFSNGAVLFVGADGSHHFMGGAEG